MTVDLSQNPFVKSALEGNIKEFRAWLRKLEQAIRNNKKCVELDYILANVTLSEILSSLLNSQVVQEQVARGNLTVGLNALLSNPNLSKENLELLLNSEAVQKRINNSNLTVGLSALLSNPNLSKENLELLLNSEAVQKRINNSKLNEGFSALLSNPNLSKDNLELLLNSELVQAQIKNYNITNNFSLIQGLNALLSNPNLNKDNLQLLLNSEAVHGQIARRELSVGFNALLSNPNLSKDNLQLLLHSQVVKGQINNNSLNKGLNALLSNPNLSKDNLELLLNSEAVHGQVKNHNLNKGLEAALKQASTDKLELLLNSPEVKNEIAEENLNNGIESAIKKAVSENNQSLLVLFNQNTEVTVLIDQVTVLDLTEEEFKNFKSAQEPKFESKIILSSAFTGVRYHPAVLSSKAPDITIAENMPVSPEQMAQNAKAVYDAGVRYIHIHARNPKTGEQTGSADHYRETFEAVRKVIPGVLLGAPTSRKEEVAKVLDAGMVVLEASGAENFTPEAVANVEMARAKPAIGSADFLTIFTEPDVRNAEDREVLGTTEQKGDSRRWPETVASYFKTLEKSMKENKVCQELEITHPHGLETIKKLVELDILKLGGHNSKVHAVILLGFSKELGVNRKSLDLALNKLTELQKQTGVDFTISVGAVIMPNHSATKERRNGEALEADKHDYREVIEWVVDHNKSFADKGLLPISIFRTGLEDTPVLFGKQQTNASLARHARQVFAELGVGVETDLAVVNKVLSFTALEEKLKPSANVKASTKPEAVSAKRFL